MVLNMGSATVNKKRKLREDTDAAASEAVAATKKSKKSKAPAPPVESPSEDEEGDEDDSGSEDGSGPENEEAAPGDESDEADEEAGDDAGGDELPKAGEPLLPPTATEVERFEDLNLSDRTMRAIKEMGFTKMTGIQRSVSTRAQSGWVSWKCTDTPP